MNEPENSAPLPSKKATISLICGLLSLVGSVLVGLLVLPVALAGLVLGFMSLKASNKTSAIIGIATSALSMLFGLIVSFLLVSLLTYSSEAHTPPSTLSPGAYPLFDDDEDY